MALVSSNRRRLARLAERGSLGAQKALDLLANPSRFLSTVQVGLTFGSIIAATFGGAPLSEALEPYLNKSSWVWLHDNADKVSKLGVSFVIGSMTIICAELIPKRIGLSNPEGLAVILSRPMALIAWFASPFVLSLSLCADVFMRIIGRHRTQEDTMSEDELRMMVDQGMATGVLHATEHRMVHGALSLDQITAERLMTPSNRVVWLNLEDCDEVNWRKIVASGHTWFPVFRGSPDYPLGVVSVKRLWANLSLVGSAKIEDLMSPPPTVMPEYTGTQLLEKFRNEKLHIVLVNDEFGRIMGVVSLDDVLESVVGELPKEGSRLTNQKQVKRREDGSWLVDAAISLKDFRRQTGIIGNFPNEEIGTFRTIAGFITRTLGRIPSEGDRIEVLGHILEIVDMDGHRIDKVLIMPISKHSQKL